MKIAYIFNKGRLTRLPKVATGETPNEFFYGAIELERAGHDVDYFEIDHNWAPGIAGGVVNVLGQVSLVPEKMTGGVLFKVKEILEKLKQYDVIIGTTSGIGFALACWKSLGKIAAPILTIHCGLLNNPYNLMRRSFTSILLSKMQTVLFGEAELQPMLDLFKGAHGKIQVNQFGVDPQFWYPIDKKKGEYILSVGNDGRRDFNVLIKAASNIPCEIKILTSRELPAELPENITLVKGSWHKETVTDMDLRELYQNAQCVVITLHESYQPSGQSVALQAMACGCPVVMTKTNGLWSEELMVDHHNVIFVPPGDPNDVKKSVTKILNDRDLRSKLSRNGRLTVEETSNSKRFADTMGNVCMQLKNLKVTH